MQRALLIFATLIVANIHSLPEGTFHRQYKYHSSSSQYANNQLQEKTEDEGFVAQHGDLEGRQKPQTDGYTSHIRYQNPNGNPGEADDLTQQTETVDLSGLKTKHGSSHGHRTGSYGQNAGFNTGSLHGTHGSSSSHSSESSYAYGGSYNTGSTTSGDSQLRSLEQKLQSDLTRQLQHALSNDYGQSHGSSSSYSNTFTTTVNSEADLRRLEEELKRNLTQQLQAQLHKQGGGARGSYSYTISTSGGQYQPHQQSQTVYTSEDIQRLQQQLETNLHDQLQQSYQRQQGSGSSGSNTGKFYVVKTYGVTSNLGDITKQLETDLARQLQDAVRRQHSSSQSYSHSYTSNTAQMNADLEQLKQELRRNLTQQLQDQLEATYGTQGNRGTYSYTITSGGKRNQHANYDNQELDDLKRELENKLIKQLERQVQTEYTHSTSSYNSQTSQNAGSTYGSRRPTTNHGTSSSSTHYDDSSAGHNVYITRPTISSDSQIGTSSSDSNSYLYGSTTYQKPVPSDSYYKPSTSNAYVPHQVVEPVPSYRPVTRFTVVQPVVPLATVIRRCENDLKYEITPQYVQEQIRWYKQRYDLEDEDNVDFNVVLRQIKNDFKNKLNKKIDDELKRTYGEQVRVGTYYHSKLTNSDEPQSTANYRVSDFDDLKREIEDKLFEQLTTTVRQEESNYVVQHQNSHGVHGSSSGHLSKYNTYGEDSTNYQQRVPTAQYASGTTHSSNQYTFAANTQSADLDSQLSAIRSDLERQLQQQLQDYRTNNAHRVTSSSQTQQYDQSYWNTIKDELRANYTRQLQNTLQQKYGLQGQRGGVTYKISSTSPSFNYNKKVDDFTKALEADINRQVTDGLSRYTFTQQQSGHGYGFGKPNVYSSSGLLNANAGFASSSGYQQGSSYSSSSSTSGLKHGSYSLGHQHTDLDEDCMHDDPTIPTVHNLPAFDLTAQTQSLITSEQKVEGYQVKDSSDEENTQQVVQTNVPQLYTGLDQSVEEQDKSLSQSSEETYTNSEEQHTVVQQHQQVSNLGQILNLGQQTIDLTQQTQDSSKSEDLVQQTEDLTQQTEDLTQKTEDLAQQTIHLGQQTLHVGQQSDDLTQKTEDLGQQTINLGQQTLHLGQQSEDLTQKTQGFGQQTVDLGQQTEDLGQQTIDLGQQTVDLGQETLDLGQQTVEDGQKLETIDYSDLTQQTDDDFGQLQFSGHSSQEQLSQQQLHKYTTQQKQDLVQQHANSQELTQQQENLSLEGLTQQSVHDFSLSQQKQESGELTQQVEDGFENLHLASGSNKFHPQINLNQGTVHHQSASYQSASSYSSSHSASYSSSSHQHSAEVTATIQEITTPKPGFWKRLGHSIESSYHTAKDKAKTALNLR